MGNRYWVTFAAYTPSTTEQPTCVSGSGRRIRLIEAHVGGGGSTSAAQCLSVSVSATGTTPTNTVTPTKAEHSEQPASNFTANRTWATAPVGASNFILLPYNALGGGFRWTATAKSPALEARNGEVIVVKTVSGITYQATNLSLLIEED